MNTYTPGPWKATYNKRFDWWTIHHEGECEFGGTSTVCHVKDFQPDHKEANARLIAAAPEMLAVMKLALQLSKDHPSFQLWGMQAFWDVIAKAEGRT